MVSTRFLDALRAAHKTRTTATLNNLIDGASTKLDIVDGEVTIDRASDVRRTLSMSVPPVQASWDALDSPGAEIVVKRSIKYVDGSIETCPLGVFVVDQDEIDYGPSGNISITAPDRSIKIKRNRFGTERASIASNTVHAEIQRLVEACYTSSYPFPGWAQLDTSVSTQVGPLVWDDGDRWAAITQLCTDSGLELFFDANGKAVLRLVPQLTDTSIPVWTVDATDNGVLVSADRQRDRSRTYNAVIATTNATDIMFNPVEVKNTTAGDPLNVTGPLGYVPFYLEGNYRSSGQATAAARAKLSVVLGQAKQLSLGAVPNPSLTDGQVIRVILPRIDRNTLRPSELHIIDSVTVPLTPTEPQQILTRSTRPDTDGT